MLGPILFVLFINDLPIVVKKALYLFADDTKLLAGKMLQMEKWLKEVHPNKCMSLQWESHQKIKQIHSLLWFFKDRSVSIVKKANSMVGLIRRSVLHLSPEMFCMLCITFTRSHLSHAHKQFGLLSSANITQQLNLFKDGQ